MRIIILSFLLLSLSNCHAKPGVDHCENMCNSSGQGYVKVMQYSDGVCICDNEEGQKVADGYHMYLNGQCNGPEEDRD